MSTYEIGCLLLRFAILAYDVLGSFGSLVGYHTALSQRGVVRGGGGVDLAVESVMLVICMYVGYQSYQYQCHTVAALSIDCIVRTDLRNKEKSGLRLRNSEKPLIYILFDILLSTPTNLRINFFSPPSSLFPLFLSLLALTVLVLCL